ncbi:hypothetical protein [Actinocrispum sp. NPDC049592]|uniref:hypothetical protein n=1 Tax=Actinocrispum sp. NPDC049592 TaxID=3154835 RepID=UPI00343F8F79
MTAQAVDENAADRIAQDMLDVCVHGGVLPPPPDDLWDLFARTHASIRENFRIPATSLSPVAARVLFGVAACTQPARLAGLGTYVGNLFAYLAGPGFGPYRCYDGDLAIGIEIDEGAAAAARQNFEAAGFTPGATFETRDARNPIPAIKPWQLLLVDADDPHRRKAVYHDLLVAWQACLAPRGVVLAHDTRYPAFAEQVAPYLDLVRGPGFEISVPLPVDEYGLELSVVR